MVVIKCIHYKNSNPQQSNPPNLETAKKRRP